MSRAIRVACSFMMARKRSRAGASLRAGPCNVSMKPDSEASGVRSSWLALATKSDRISSTSYIAILDPDARADVLSQVLEAADGLPEPISIPYTTDVNVAERVDAGS